MKDYIFTSKRLGFRSWEEADIPQLAEINADKEVMEFFPATHSEKETREFIQKMQVQYEQKGFCYFAVDKLENSELIGFIGLSEQNFSSSFTPCIDIGWRLKKNEWKKGYASEGAKACLNFAFSQLSIERVFSIAPVVNTRSQAVMKKIGMRQVMIFNHPKLLNDRRLEKCVLYEINRLNRKFSQSEKDG